MTKSPESLKQSLLNSITKIQISIYVVLMLMLTAIIIFALVESIVSFTNMVFFDSTPFILTGAEVLKGFDFFLLILIGLELMDSIKAFIETKKINVIIVIILAIIAISRKIIIMDMYSITELQMIGIGVIMLALALGYYFVKKGDTFTELKQ